MGRITSEELLAMSTEDLKIKYKSKRQLIRGKHSCHSVADVQIFYFIEDELSNRDPEFIEKMISTEDKL